MKTERLYYNDPYLLEFDATVLESRRVGDRQGVILDRTAFYPTSGGQPNDLGAIDDMPVLDCYEDEETGNVVHVLGAGKVTDHPGPSGHPSFSRRGNSPPETGGVAAARSASPIGRSLKEGRRGGQLRSPLFPPGTRVHCRIDAARRTDHMQQHSGQHVLSQAFVELFNWPTVSFHLGVETCTIDLPADSITREQATKAEDLANRIVRENRNVAVRYLTHENIGEVGLRKPTERTGEIRVIDIAGYDRSACGGTHVRMTGEIGPILITRIDRAKKQSRVEFICGDRVIRYAREANRTLEAISQTISASPLETANAVRSLWDELQQARKRIDDIDSQLMDYEAAQFPVKEGLAIGAFKNRGIEKLKMLALKICSRPNMVALLADQSDQLRVVFARSADSPVDAAAVLKKCIDRFGGRGGGRPSLAQGGGFTAESADAVLSFAAAVLAFPPDLANNQ